MLPFSEACERNKLPILDVLQHVLKRRSNVLEIGSGTGQHAVYFAAHLSHLIWHPTEQLAYLPDLCARVEAEGGDNIARPTLLDVSQTIWPIKAVDAIFTANTLHIMAWSEVIAMFRGVGNTLRGPGSLCIYGPFRYLGRYTSSTNEDFDAMLRERDPRSGIRDISDVKQLAAESGLTLSEDHDLPAYNRLLVFEA